MYDSTLSPGVHINVIYLNRFDGHMFPILLDVNCSIIWMISILLSKVWSYENCRDKNPSFYGQEPMWGRAREGWGDTKGFEPSINNLMIKPI